MSAIERYALSDEAPAHVYVHRGFVLDQHVTGMVRNLPTPSRSFFGLEQAHLFREQFRRRHQMFVLVERRGCDQPGVAKVRCIDGSVVVLASPLNFDPQEGACVQLLLGYKNTYIDGRTAEKWEKEQITWI